MNAFKIVLMISKKKLKYLNTNSIPRQDISVNDKTAFLYDGYFSIISPAIYDTNVVKNIRNTYFAFHDI